MKTKVILLLIFLLLSCSIVFAQTDYNNGLVLRGTNFDWSEKIEDDHVLFTAKLRMEFVNEGKEPIILINPNQEFGKWQSEVYFSNEIIFPSGEKGKFEFLKAIQRKAGEAKDLKGLAENLDVEKPPQNLVVIIKPGDSLKFYDNLEVKQGYSRDDRDLFRRIKWEGTSNYWKNGLPLSKCENFKLEYKFSLIKYQTDVDLLEKLQGRWRKFGYLPVDSSGGFSITSEALKNG